MFWWLLTAGIIIRFVAITHPLLDAQSTRQTQTADAIRSLIAEPGFQLDGAASWRGQTGARVAMEFPAYNYLVQGSWEILRGVWRDPSQSLLNADDIRWLDMSGKIVSILLWSLSFLFLQGIFNRLLDPASAFWANFLFVFAPLSVFFGQAVMPEMLIQTAAFGFILAILRYEESPTKFRILAALLAALCGLVTKLPEFSHLCLFAIAFLWWKRGWRFVLLRPLHWAAIIPLLLGIKLWSGFVDATNARYFFDWSASESLKAFLGDPQTRLSPLFYKKVIGYVSAFVVTPIGGIICLLGFWRAIQRRGDPKIATGLLWLASLAFFYLVWGPRTAGGHNYYNLPALGPACLLFGLGASALVSWASIDNSTWKPYRVVVATLTFIFFVTGLVFGSWYLFRQDLVLYRTIEWARANIPGDEQVIVCQLHLPDTVEYPHHPAFAYYTGLTTWMWTRYTPEWEKKWALKNAHWLIITHPEEHASLLESFRQNYKKIKGKDSPFAEERLAGFCNTAFVTSDFSVLKAFPQN